MFLRALGYILLPVVVIGAAGVLGYVVPAALFPHWSADAHATVAMIAVPVVAIALVWAAVVRGHRRGGDEFSRPGE
jgi:uncharacterized membrane-anchored protein